ncbi:MAG TPA: hypothetical protein VKD22_05005 [Ramlibacter sp.]|nr:hypothetical protein [Ramlibacter sp.]
MENTSRYWRREARNGRLIADGELGPEVKGRFYQGPAGTYRHVVAHPDGSLTIGPKAFADDVVAFVSASISTNPTIDDAIKVHLKAFVNEMDARAVRRHGYSHNPDEAAVDWNAE